MLGEQPLSLAVVSRRYKASGERRSFHVFCKNDINKEKKREAVSGSRELSLDYLSSIELSDIDRLEGYLHLIALDREIVPTRRNGLEPKLARAAGGCFESSAIVKKLYRSVRKIVAEDLPPDGKSFFGGFDPKIDRMFFSPVKDLSNGRSRGGTLAECRFVRSDLHLEDCCELS